VFVRVSVNVCSYFYGQRSTLKDTDELFLCSGITVQFLYKNEISLNEGENKGKM
jgi:hypothetical protein